MVKQKSEWKCSGCEKIYIKWQGICYDCGGINTILETKKSVNRASVRRRWKGSERGLGTDMQNADGEDPKYRGVASSTGRVGFITGMRFDTVSRTYVNEDKNRPLPKWLIDAWILIIQISIDKQKNAHLRLNPPNVPSHIKVNGEKFKTPSMSVITYDHHLELVSQVRVLSDLEKIIYSDEKYQDLQEELWRLKKR